jgi:hypothetical protein
LNTLSPSKSRFQSPLLKPKAATELILLCDSFFIDGPSVNDTFYARVATQLSAKLRHPIPADHVRLLLQCSYPRYSKLYLLGVIDDAKQGLDRLRSHLSQRWKKPAGELSSSRYVANQRKVIDQLTGIEEFCEASDDWPLQLTPFRMP